MSYYSECLRESAEYEWFIYGQLQDILGWTMRHNYGRSAQLKGENSLGIEIKCDGRMAHTGNVFIEVKERNEHNPNWVDSGIYRPDNTFLYLIGDHDQAFIFSKKTLRREYEAGRFTELRTNQMNTGKGFLIPIPLCVELAELYLVFPKTETAEDVLKEL